MKISSVTIHMDNNGEIDNILSTVAQECKKISMCHSINKKAENFEENLSKLQEAVDWLVTELEQEYSLRNGEKS